MELLNPVKCMTNKDLEGVVQAMFLSARHWVSLGRHVFGAKIPIKHAESP